MDGLSIAASLVEIAPRITDGTIRTIYQPGKAQFVLRIFAGEDIRLVIDFSEATIRTTTRDIENPVKPSTFVNAPFVCSAALRPVIMMLFSRLPRNSTRPNLGLVQ